MRCLVQSDFEEPKQDPGEDEPLVVHKRSAATENDALVVFVHGLGGKRYGKRATWGHFPRFIYQDLPNIDVGLYRFRTLFGRLRWWRSIDLEAEARVLADTLRDATAYNKIVLVGHSMGGLLCKATIRRLCDSNQLPALTKVRGLVLMATPQLGSLNLPRFLWAVTEDARALRPHGNLVSSLNETFVNRLNMRDDGRALGDLIPMPTWAVVASSDYWVDALSATLNLPASQQKNVRGSHKSIVKPVSSDTEAYLFVLDKIKACLKHSAPVPAPPPAPKRTAANDQRLRVVAFDVDGTLIRGLEFSWTAVWRYLGFPDDVRKAGMIRYLRGQTTYQEWCEWACGMFRTKGLRREDFKKIVAELTITKNLHEALSILKTDGFVTGIISGGIDVFLQELIPDAESLFDYIFINRLQFDDAGLISGVEATPYDFEGKAAALELMCTQNGYAQNQSVFVGEGFNDEYVANWAGLTIAYPPTAQGFRNAAAVEIKSDDLMEVVTAVM